MIALGRPRSAQSFDCGHLMTPSGHMALTAQAPAIPETPTTHKYVIALGSNQRHPKLGLPRLVVAAAFTALNAPPLRVLRHSKLIISRPIGPSMRVYVNAAALIETTLEPDRLLCHLKNLESRFGRRISGQAWRARVLDLDLILWSGGIWAEPELSVPHRLFRSRTFVLDPVANIAPDWRDPISRLSIRHLKVRLDRAGRQS